MHLFFNLAAAGLGLFACLALLACIKAGTIDRPRASWASRWFVEYASLLLGATITTMVLAVLGLLRL
jgi:hypothetical protein